MKNKNTNLATMTSRSRFFGLAGAVAVSAISALLNGCAAESTGLTSNTAATVNLDHIIFVKNNVANGDGSMASPFNNLASAIAAHQAGDTIFIYEGDGTSSNLDTGAILLDDVTLQGEGSALIVSGTTVVPAGNKPVITNSTGDGVVPANRNVIKGLKVVNAQYDGIDGDAIESLTLDNVEVLTSGSSSAHNGLELSNLLTGTISLIDTKINGNFGDGLNIDVDGSEIVTLSIQNSEINSNQQNGLHVMTHDTAQVTLSASNGAISSNSIDGVKLELNDSVIQSSNITLNTIASNGSHGIEVDSFTNAQHTLHIDQNVINANTSLNGIDVDVRSNTISSLYVQGNSITNQTGDIGYNLYVHNNAIAKTKIDNNIFTNNTADSLMIHSINTAQVCAEVTNNTSDDTLYFWRQNTSTFDRALNNNTGTVVTNGSVSTVAVGFCGL